MLTECQVLHQAGALAQKRLARGIRLNHPEVCHRPSCIDRKLNLTF